MKIKTLLVALFVACPAIGALDNFGNFAKGTLSIGVDSSATSFVLVSGGGSHFPAAPFNATVWNASNYGDPSDDPNREIVRVTLVSGDTLTVVRAQESTTASAHNTRGKTYLVVASITAKTFTTDLPTSFAPIASPTFTGTVTIPSPFNLGATSITITGTELNRLSGVTSNVQTQISANTSAIALLAPMASPALTGIPTAPTATNGTNTTQLATTAFVLANGGSNAITALTGDVTATGPGSVAGTLATVNTNTGSFGSSTAIPNFSVNGKGLLTAAGTSAVIAPAGTLSGATLANGVTASSLTSFGASPTLTTPTIASFTNATHNHSNTAGGGQIDATTALSNGTNGSGAVALVGSPTFTTPNIGAATAGGTLTMGNTNAISFNGTNLVAEGANITALTNGVTGQSFRIFNTTDSNTAPVNAEWYECSWSGNTMTCGTVKAGTGTVRQLTLNGSTLNFNIGGASKASLSSTAFTLGAGGGNAIDLGQSGVPSRTVYVATSIQSGQVKTLVETSATSFATIAIPNSGGCAGKAVYTVFAADATNTQIVSGELFFSAVATSGGTVTAATLSDQHNLNPVTSGTLTNTMTQTTGANLLTLQANATSSLTQTTLEVRYRIELQAGTCTVTGL